MNSLEDLDVQAGEYIKSYMAQTVKNINEQAHVNEKELIDVQRRRYFLTVSGVISYIIAFALGVSFSTKDHYKKCQHPFCNLEKITCN